MTKLVIKVGATYSNGNFHSHWEVRQVLAQGTSCGTPECVEYKVLAGPQRRRNFICSMEEFSRWARYEVVRDENSWRISSDN
ncbi:MAG: hypothetical protein ACK4ZS_04315 [Sulfurimicrobium sp.]